MIDLPAVAAPRGFELVATLFSESASRVVLSVRPGDLKAFFARAAEARVPAIQIGSVGGDRIVLSVDGQVVIDESLRDAEQIWSTAIGSYFENNAPSRDEAVHYGLPTHVR
jgi:hypothetical protein